MLGRALRRLLDFVASGNAHGGREDQSARRKHRISAAVMEALEPRVMLSVTPTITALEDSVMAGSAVHVQATNSNVDGQSPQLLKYGWNFGDVVNGKPAPYNDMKGFNAAHVYDTPGTYLVTLSITDPSNNVVTATHQVTVSADTRQKIYVAASGSDANNGSTPALAVATAAKAQQLLNTDGDNTELLFNRGDSFSLSSALTINHSNVLVGAYGTGDRPLLNWTSTGGNVLSLGSGVSNVTIQDLSADTPALANQLGESGAPFVTGNGGTDITLRNCELLNVGYGFNGNGNPDGVLMEGNVAPLAGGLRGYLAWLQGSDWTIVGNDVANSTREVVIAGGTVSRVNVSDNDLTNLDRTGSGDSGDTSKGTIQLDGVTWGYAGGNYLADGQATVGWTGSLSAQTNVVKDNDIQDTTIQIGTGADGTLLSHNLIHYSIGANGANGISVSGYANGRGVDGLAVDHNSIIAPMDPTSGALNPAQFMSLHGSATGVSITNNLYNPADSVSVDYGTAGLWLNVNSLSGMTLGGNEWGPFKSAYSGYYHRMLNSSGSEIWLNPSQWQALVPTDTFPANLNNPATAGAGLLAPRSPTGLSATGGSGQIALTWTAPTGTAAADSYNLYRNDGSGYRLYQTGLSTTGYTDTSVITGARYAYKVSAVDASGEGRLSEEAAAVSTGISIPSAPAGLNATGGDGQVTLTWATSTGATSYNIYRGTAAGGEGATPIATGVSASPYTDTTVTNGTPYFYKVTAVNSAGESGKSNEATATPEPAIPSAPTGLSAAAGDAQATLTWTTSTGATSYNIYRSTTSGGEGTSPVKTGVTGTNYTDTGLTNGTPYYYTVTAVNGGGESPQSTEASATPNVGVVLNITGNGSVNEGSPYTLNLSASGPWAAGITSIVIDWGDGSAPQTVAAGTTSAAHTYADGPNTETIQATAQSHGDNYASNDQAVTVDNVAPTAAITGAPSNPIAGTAITLGSTVTDPSSADQAAGFTYAWAVTKDGNAFASATTSDFTFTPDTAGSYAVSLTATDKDGGAATASDTLDVTAPFAVVLPPNPPLAGQPVTVQLHNYQPQTTAVASWQIDWGDGSQPQTITDSATHTSDTDAEWDLTHTYVDAGSYTIHAVATDTSSVQHDAGSVTEPMLIPPPSVSPLVIPDATAGSPLTITATAAPYRSYADTLNYQWSFIDPANPSTPIVITTDQPSVTLMPADAGDWSVTLTVTDAAAAGPSTVEQGFKVAAPMPLTITGPSVLNVNGAANFNASGTATNNLTWTAVVNGTTAATGSGLSFAFTPTQTGNYAVTATGHDSGGTPFPVSQSLTVTQLAPSVTISGPDVGFVGKSMVLTATPQDADSAESLTYGWTLLHADGSTYSIPDGTITNLPSLIVPGSLAAGSYKAQVAVSDGPDSASQATFDFSILADPGSSSLEWGGLAYDGGFTNGGNGPPTDIHAPNAIMRAPDGKIIVATNYDTSIGYPHRSQIVRFNPDLTLDTTFGPAHTGYVELASEPELGLSWDKVGSSTIHSLVFDPHNSDILAIGTINSGFPSGSYLAIFALASTAHIGTDGQMILPGMLDPTFNGGKPFILNLNASLTEGNTAMVLQDGSILVGGEVGLPANPDPVSGTAAALTQLYGTSPSSAPNFVPDFLLLKLTTSGQLVDDGSFGTGGIAEFSNITGLPVDMADNHIDMTGQYLNGSPPFDDETIYGVGIEKMALNSNGEILVVGEINRALFDLVETQNQYIDVGIGVALYMANGDLDASFGTNGATFVSNSQLDGNTSQFGIGTVDAMELRPNGDILLAGIEAHTYNSSAYIDGHVMLADFTDNGNLNPAYGIDGNGIITIANLTNSKIPSYGDPTEGARATDAPYVYRIVNTSMVFEDSGLHQGDLIAELGGGTAANPTWSFVRISPSGSQDTSFANMPDGTILGDSKALGQVENDTNPAFYVDADPNGIVVSDDEILFGGVNKSSSLSPIDGNYTPSIATIVRYKISDNANVADIAATATSPISVDLTWRNTGYGQSGFHIERATSETGLGTGAIIDSVGADQTQFTDKTASADTTYYYAVVPFTDGDDGNVVSGMGAVASVHTRPAPTQQYQQQELVEIPLNGATVSTQTTLQTGATYILVASGTFNLGDGTAAGDSAYWYSTSDPKVIGMALGGAAYGLALGNQGGTLGIPSWGAFDAAAHSYIMAYVGDGKPLSFALQGAVGSGAPLTVALYALQTTPITPAAPDLPEGLGLQITVPAANADGANPILSAAGAVDILAAENDGSNVPWQLSLIDPTGHSTLLAQSSTSSGSIAGGGAPVYTLEPTTLAGGLYTLSLSTTFAAPQQNYTVTMPIAIEPPVLHIISPAATTIGTPPVLDHNTSIQIVAAAADGSAVPWQLWLIPAPSGAQQVLLASGSQSAGTLPENPSTVITLDPADYANGAYTLKLTTAYNGTQPQVICDRSIAIETMVKTGGLETSATDESIPTAIGSLDIHRSYDSNRVDVTDSLPGFGPGWTFDTIDSQLQITGQADTFDPTQTSPTLRAGDLVTLTIPGDGKHVFEFDPILASSTSLYAGNPEEVLYRPHFVAVDGSGATLTLSRGMLQEGPQYDFLVPLDYQPYKYLAYSPLDAEFTSIQGVNVDAAGSGTNKSIGFNLNGEYTGVLANAESDALVNVYRFKFTYVLTTSNGLSYTIDAGTGQIESVSNASGATTTYSIASDGTVTATGPNNTTLFVAHTDGQGKIAEIDATGQNPINYGYDASDNLSYVQAQSGGRTLYTYQDSNFPHNLTGITNPAGATLLQAQYDPATGKLNALINADGKRIPVTSGTLGDDEATQTVVDAAGDVTQDVYNEKFGTLLRKIQNLTDDTGIVGYIVTASSFTYQTDDVANVGPALTPGVQMLQSVQTYAPFEVVGSDAVGIRYSQQPSVDSWTKQVLFDTSNSLDDVGRQQIISSSERLTSDGLLQTTLFENYNSVGSRTVTLYAYNEPVDFVLQPIAKPQITTVELRTPDSASSTGYDNQIQSTTYMFYDADGHVQYSLTAVGRDVPGGAVGDGTLTGGYPAKLYLTFSDLSADNGLQSLAWDQALGEYHWKDASTGIEFDVIDNTVGSGSGKTPVLGDAWSFYLADPHALGGHGVVGMMDSVDFDGTPGELSTAAAAFLANGNFIDQSNSQSVTGASTGIGITVPGWIALGTYNVYSPTDDSSNGGTAKGLLTQTQNISAVINPDGTLNTSSVHSFGTTLQNVYYGAGDYTLQGGTWVPNPGASYGQVKYSLDAAGQETYYAYDQAGHTLLQYVYKSWTDANGNLVNGWVGTTSAYDSAGRMTDTYSATYLDSSATGPQTPWTAHTLPVIAGGPAGIQVDTSLCPVYAAPLLTQHVDYDALSRTADTIDQYGGQTTYTYDANGNTLETQYPDGTQQLSVYDLLNQPIWQTNRYDPADPSTALTTRTVYNQLGQVIETQQYSGALIQLSSKNLGSATVPNTFVNTVDPNKPDGEPVLGAGQSLLSTTQKFYDAAGNTIETIDPSGLRTGTIYYPNGKVQYTGPLNSAAPDGGRLVTTDAGVASYEFSLSDFASHSQTDPPAYDPSLGLFYTKSVDRNGHATQTYTDALGRTVRTVYADGTFTQTLYGMGSQPVAGHEVAGQTITGYQETKIDQNGNATDYFYDQAGNLTDVYEPAVLDADPNSLTYNQMVRPHWRYAYDAAGNQTSQTDPKGNVTTFTYDQNGNRIGQTLPDGEHESWTYDNRGRMLTYTDFKGQTTKYLYDDSAAAQGRLIEEDRFTGADDGTPDEKTTYGYDNLGRQNLVQEYVGSTLTRTESSTYDSVTGQLASYTTPEGTINYEYDPATGKHIRTWTADTDTSYGYDEQGRLTSVTVTKLNGRSVNLVTSYTYDPAGNLLTQTDPNGVTTTYTYDALNRLADEVVKESNGTNVFSQAYTLADNGQRDEVIEQRFNGDGSVFSTTKIDWTYDALNRLTSETYDAGDDGPGTGDYKNIFAYDLASNRTQETIDTNDDGTNDQTLAYAYNGDDELTAEGPDTNDDGIPDAATATTYGYDLNGSQTTVTQGTETDTYIYNLRNKLVSVTKDGVTTTYAYDENGNRIQETMGGVTTDYLTDKNNPTGYTQPLEEKVAGNVTRTYILGNRVLAQADANGVVTYLMTDGHGSTRALIDSTGTVTQAFDYDAFGGAINFDPATAGTEFLFGGDAIYDAPSGLYLHGNGVRPTFGFLFIQRDIYPGDTNDPLSLHKYLYANANPVYGSDPTGYFDWGGMAVDVAAGVATMGITYALAAPAIGGAAVLGGVLGGTINALEQQNNSGLSGGAAFEIGFFGGLATGLLGTTVNSWVGAAAGEAITDTGNWLFDSATHVDFTSSETWKSMVTIAAKSFVAGALGFGGDATHEDEAILKWFFSFASQTAANDIADFFKWYNGIKV